MVSAAEAVGLVAGLLVALAYIPQVVRVWRLKDAQQISLAFTLLSLCGTALWLGYGLALSLLSVTIWNSVNFVLLLSLLSVKLKFGMGRDASIRTRPD
jgi:MtN3 and saliva related transmembrane protein